MQRVEKLERYRSIHKSIASRIEKSNEVVNEFDPHVDPVQLSLAIREKARLSREIAQDLRRYSRMLKRA